MTPPSMAVPKQGNDSFWAGGGGKAAQASEWVDEAGAAVGCSGGLGQKIRYVEENLTNE